ncbi:MAG: choice-of-anchor Q domain-containing protein [Bacteroidota bacterium]
MIYYVSKQGNDANSGTSWNTAKESISAAIQLPLSAGDQIWVAEGTYQESLTLPGGVGLFGGFTGSESNLSERSLSTVNTIIDGRGAGKVITIPENANADTVVDGLTIQNGKCLIYCNSNSSPLINGNTITGARQTWDMGTMQGNNGGIYCNSASPTISNNIISNNVYSAGFPGILINAGGIYISGGAPTVTNNTIGYNKINNVSTTGGLSCGGGMYVKNADGVYCNNIFYNNRISGGPLNGGGVYVSGGTPAFSYNCFSDNSPSARYGLDAQTGDLQEDPLFYNPQDGDFTLQSLSPCLNAGLDTALPTTDTTDRYGNPRVDGSAVDMGCFEQAQFQVLPLTMTPSTGIPPLTVSIESATTSAAIAYTTDGTTPTEQSMLYEGPITLESGCELEAVGFQEGWTDSPIVVGNFGISLVIRVAPWGDDSNDGATWELAKQTIGAANSAADNNAAIWVARGTYLEKITISKSIQLIGGFGGWEDSADQRDPNNFLSIMDGDGYGTLVTFDGGGTVAAEITGMILQNGSRGILCSSGTSPLIQGNIIRNMQYTPPLWGDINFAAITLDTSNAIVTSNLIHNSSYDASPITTIYAGGILALNGAPQIIGNTVDRCSGVVNTNANSILFGGIICKNSDAVVANNICTNNGCTYDSSHGPTDQYPPTAGIAITGGSPSIAYNCAYGNTSNQFLGTSGGTGALTTDPQYIQSSSGNYQLSSSSPCIDAGTTSLIPLQNTTDIENLPRVIEDMVDMGAYETQPVALPLFDQLGSASPAFLRVTNQDSESVLHYTTDGSEPTADSPVLNYCAMLNEPCTVKVMALAPSGLQSATIESQLIARSHIVYVSKNGSDANDGSSWSNAVLTIKHALGLASKYAAIWVAAGTYSEKISLINTVALLGGFAGTETSMEQRNWQENPTIIDGNGSGTVVSIASAANTSTWLDGFTIENGLCGVVSNGNASAGICHNIIRNHQVSWGIEAPLPTIKAGAVQIKNGNPLVTDNLIVNNSYGSTYTGVGIRGGGLGIYGGAPCIVNNTIADNQIFASSWLANGALGAGIYIDSGTPFLENNIVANNVATANGGTMGGISATGGNAYLDYNCLYNNQGGDIGGVQQGPNGVTGDPCFVDPTAGNYQLGPGSSAINTGNTEEAFLSEDLNDQARVVGSNIDMGSYESQNN